MGNSSGSGSGRGRGGCRGAGGGSGSGSSEKVWPKCLSLGNQSDAAAPAQLIRLIASKEEQINEGLRSGH